MTSLPEDRAVVILEKEGIRKAILRMAHQIIEHNTPLERLLLVGIPKKGTLLAKKLVSAIEKAEGIVLASGSIDISMHRDDLNMRHGIVACNETHLPLNINDLFVVLVDDVLFTGRSCRAALDAITSFGRPSRIQLAVLIDRGLRELPIAADFIGKKINTEKSDSVLVNFSEINQQDSVLLIKN